MKTVWIDVETTGVDYQKDTIIELAAIYEYQDTIETFHRYCLPKEKTPDFNEITELTGITWEYLEKNGISEEQLYKDFIQWLSIKIDKYNKKDKAIFAAYSARFDNDFIRELFKRNNDKYFGSWFYAAPLDIISTVILAVRKGILEMPENFKNATIAKMLDIEIKAHSAESDIMASRNIQIILESRIFNQKTL